MQRSLAWAIIAVLLGWVVFSCPIRNDAFWMDRNCGSVRFDTRYFGMTVKSNIHHSALEKWIISHEGAWQPSWQFCNSNGKTIWGQRWSCGCGLPPKIYALASVSSGDVLEQFVNKSSHTQIAEFLRVVRTGNLEQQEHAVNAAFSVVFGDVR